MKFTEPIRNMTDVCKIMAYFLELGQLRNHVLIVLGVFTALRIGDLLKLTWKDVYDFSRKCVRSQITLTENKTGKSKIIMLNKEAVKALLLYASKASLEPGKFLFENKRTGKPIGRTQAYRLIRAAGEAVGIPERVSCHSLRKTFGYRAWKNKTPLTVIMQIYNHHSVAVTMRYLGVTQDDINEAYERMSFA